jgi:hypothetical protein
VARRRPHRPLGSIAASPAAQRLGKVYRSGGGGVIGRMRARRKRAPRGGESEDSCGPCCQRRARGTALFCKEKLSARRLRPCQFPCENCFWRGIASQRRKSPPGGAAAFCCVAIVRWGGNLSRRL